MLVDANVWYSRTLRDWVCLLGVDPHSSLYTVLWTEDIMAETLANLRARHPKLEGGKVAHIREQIIEVFPDGQVRDYDCTFPLRDVKDSHVHGAAVAGGADILLTSNIRDFVPPGGSEDALPYELYTPDDFLMLVDASDHSLVERTACLIDGHHRSKGVQYSTAERLRAAGAPQFARVVAKVLSVSANPGRRRSLPDANPATWRRDLDDVIDRRL